MAEPYSISDLRAAVDTIRDLKQVQATQGEVLKLLVTRIEDVETLVEELGARLDALGAAALAKSPRALRRTR
jgi:hypothetical protein